MNTYKIITLYGEEITVSIKKEEEKDFLNLINSNKDYFIKCYSVLKKIYFIEDLKEIVKGLQNAK